MVTVLVFGVLALVVIGTAVGMLVSRNAVYSALFLVLNFATVAVLYFILGAPFIAMTQITVYAGAIMVLFLFVIMLLGGEKLPALGPLEGRRWIAILLGVVFLAEVALVVVWRGGSPQLLDTPTPDFASPAAVGMMLFTEYALPFEITSAILLVAAIGAILLTRGETTTPARPEKKE